MTADERRDDDARVTWRATVGPSGAFARCAASRYPVFVARVAADIPSHVRIDPVRIGDFCRRWKIEELALFGSVLRADFRANSDVDVLVAFAPDAGWSLLDHVAMERELAGIVGREVDLVTRKAVEGSANWIRRRAILESAQPIHVAR